MWSKLIRNRFGYVRPGIIRLILRFYPPYLGAGIRVTHIAQDYSAIRVELPLTWYNRNYVRTQFGGSIYAMTDPFYMLMLLQILGHDYIVWDKGARIDFKKPGRHRLIVEFNWTQAETDQVLAQTASGEKYVFDREVLIHDSEGLLVASVVKTLYVRRKELVSPPR